MEKNYEEIVEDLLKLDTTGNIYSIELQSDCENWVEINVVYNNYDAISEELWDYTLANSSENFHIDNLGIDQEIPKAARILYRAGE